MNPYLVWCPELCQTQANAYHIDAVNARAAACKWAKEYDEATAECRIATGDDVKVFVSEANSPEKRVEFIVCGDLVPQYSAWMVPKK